MTDILLNVFYVLVAIAMIVLILLQRGAGAQAGSGFGAGASGTVFGARGSGNFLSSSTKYLAVVFFALSLFMAYQATHRNQAQAPVEDLGVMADLPAQPATPAPAGAAPQLAPAPAAPVQPGPDAAPTQAPAASPAQAEPAATPAAPQEGSKGG